MILTIARHELRRMFYSPLAWIILGLVMFVLALLFLILLENFMTEIQVRFAGKDFAPGVTDSVIAPLFFWAGVIMLAVSPLLTMRSFSEERQTGSYALLASAPVSVTQIVLGKFLGLITFVLIMLAIMLIIPASLHFYTQIDWGKLMAGMLGLLLMLASFKAIGLYLSSLTSTPVVAAMSSFAALLLLVILYISGNSTASSSELFVYLSSFSHFLAYLEGVVDSSHIAYYLLLIILFLTLTIRHLGQQRIQG